MSLSSLNHMSQILKAGNKW